MMYYMDSVPNPKQNGSVCVDVSLAVLSTLYSKARMNRIAVQNG